MLLPLLMQFGMFGSPPSPYERTYDPFPIDRKWVKKKKEKEQIVLEIKKEIKELSPISTEQELSPLKLELSRLQKEIQQLQTLIALQQERLDTEEMITLLYLM